jgi:tyrosine-protein kinase Etk/Wzc
MDLKDILKELEEENNKSSSNQINFKYVISKYLKKWHWFALSLFLFTSVAITYVYFSTPIYLVRSSLVIKDQKKGADFTSSLLLDATASSRKHVCS